MLYYILQTIAFQLFFLIIYDVFLKKETFFNWNRAYLLATAILSIILPFVKINSLKSVIPEDFIVVLPEVLLGTQNTVPVEVNSITVEASKPLLYWEIIIYIGIAIAALLFIYKLSRLLALIYKNPKRWNGNMIIVNLIRSNVAFSFFHYVFLGEYIKEEDRVSILNHEMVHVKQKHSFDLVFFEVLRILFWFNPLVYLYQKRITILHEFIADNKVMQIQGKQKYYQNLLSQVFQTNRLSFTNSFYKQSLIKKRITMLSKTKSNRILKLKYALLIPMVFGILLYTSCDSEVAAEDVNLSELNFSIPINKESNKNIEELYKSYENEEKRMTTFLKSNPGYVKWTTMKRDEIIFEIHDKNEQAPEGYNKLEDEEGLTYYFGFDYPEHEEIDRQPINPRDYDGKKEVPYGAIDEVPTFPECESLPQSEQRKCTSNIISKFVQKNFNTDLAGELGLSGRQRISVIFKIDKEGNVIEVKSRAPHPILQEEAMRVIKSLPKMESGKHNGEAVTVPYSLPIIFQIAE